MKNAIIYGATSGIGRALALILAENNYKVFITGRRSELLDETKNIFPDQFNTFCFDVTEIQLTKNITNDIISKAGQIDLVIYCAGTGELNESLDYEIEQHTNDVNVSAFTLIADIFYNYFSKINSGHFVNISSIAGLRGNALAPAYNASKAYQINYLEGLRQRKQKNKCNFSITDIRPGFVDTDMAKGEGLFWVSPVDKAAKQIYHAIRRKSKVTYVTKRWRIIGGLLKIIPSSIYERI